MAKITQDKFTAFETVKRSGDTNMFVVDMVIKLALQLTGVKLKASEVTEIFRNYATYQKQFGEGDN